MLQAESPQVFFYSASELEAPESPPGGYCPVVRPDFFREGESTNCVPEFVMMNPAAHETMHITFRKCVRSRYGDCVFVVFQT